MNYEQAIRESRASIEHDDLRILLPRIGNQVNPKAILEIGMHQGYSMELWRNAFNPLFLIGIEKSVPTPESYTTEVGMHWNTDSHDRAIIAKIPWNYDMLFIDGDHSYEGVKKDFEMYAPMVRKGGVIVLHDAVYHHDKTEEVDIFWQELVANNNGEYGWTMIKGNENSTGMGVLWI